jgi:chromosomal replication initiator protein
LDLSTLEEKISFSSEAFYTKVRRLVGKEKVFQTWFSRTSVEVIEGTHLVLHVPSRLALDWIQKQYASLLSECVKSHWDLELRIVEGVGALEDSAENISEVFMAKNTRPIKVEPCQVARKSGYTFKGFITGPENQLAHVAMQGIASGSAHVHSPLVIVGDHGLGKTHLVSSLVDSLPGNQVICWHAEEFSNAYIQAMKSGLNNESMGSGLEAFRAMIRSKKVFILEDLDFFLEGNKKKTLDELVNSLKVLKRENRHVIITSTQPIFSYEAMAPKLANFLMSGLCVKIGAPSAISRAQLIDHYRKEYSCSLSPKCLSFVEEIPFRSPREIKGAVKQIAAYSVLEKDQLPLSVVREILSDHLRMAGEQACSQESQDLHSIAKAVCVTFGVSLQKLIATTRERHVSLARHTAMALSYDFHFTLKEIGQFYGGRLHQSVLFATKKVAARREKDMDFQRCYGKLLAELTSSLGL